MALSVVQRVSAAILTPFSATTLTINIATPTQNNLLVSTMFTRSATATNPTGFATDEEIINATNDDRVRITSKIAGASEADPQWTGLVAGDGNGTVADCFEIAGAPTTSYLDKTDDTALETSVTTLTCGPTATLAQADEIAIAAVGIRVNATGTASWSDSFTAQTALCDEASSPAMLLSASKIVAATTAVSTAASWTGSTSAIGAIATYVQAGGAPAASILLFVAADMANIADMRDMRG